MIVPERASDGHAAPLRRIAYFSMEVALEPGMATYAGGLGVLAGDALRSMADLGVPAIGVTLLCRDGYLHQQLDDRGNQRESPERWDYERWLNPCAPTVEIELFGRAITVRAWSYDIVGTAGFAVPIVLLDTDVPSNPPEVRALCGALYGDGDRYRLAQEIVLGIGGVRMLGALGHERLRKYHLNEGHAAFAALELFRASNHGRTGQWDLGDVHSKCAFTTHTPVPAGHDRFARGLVDAAIGQLVPASVLDALTGPETVNMTELALELSGHVNGVARHHAEVTRGIFPGRGIGYVTNGVHTQTWTAAPFARLYDRHLPGWRTDAFSLRYAGRLPPSELWAAHLEAKAALLTEVQARTGRALDPTALTIGFARRATGYKRADLVFSDLPRLRAIARAGPLQLVFAGKAHPNDEQGKDIIRRITRAARELDGEVAVIYLADYGIELAKLLIAGVDLWLNTPQPPLEASGTSGMKAAHNGVPSLSVLDGWWIEGHVEGSTGWSISATSDRDAAAAELYRKLEHMIAPLFRDHHLAWTRVMQHTIALNASFFNAQRMVQQYVASAYV